MALATTTTQLTGQRHHVPPKARALGLFRLSTKNVAAPLVAYPWQMPACKNAEQTNKTPKLLILIIKINFQPKPSL